MGAATVTVDLFDGSSGERLASLAHRNEISPVSGRPARARSSDALYEMNRLCRMWAGRLQQLLAVLRETPLSG